MGRYTQIKVSVAPELATAFKDACNADGVSMAGELSRFMAKHAGVRGTPKTPLGTRRQRRNELKKITERLENILENEHRYMDNIPENLQGSSVSKAAAQSVEALEETIETLGSVYD
jgi:hypothetical protein